MKPIPILDFSAISALGTTLSEHESAMRAGHGGIRAPGELLPGALLPVGEVRTPLPPLPAEVSAYDSRCARLLAACLDRLADSLSDLRARVRPDRIAVIVGTSASGNTDLEQALLSGHADGFDYHHRQTFGSAASLVRRMAGVAGPAFSVSTACSSGANAFLSASRLIHAGVCDAAIVGAVDALCLTTYHGFRALGVMDDSPCRPFDVHRKGMSLGEGAALFLLARERTAPQAGPDIFFAGGGASSDAHHMTAPDPDGLGASRAMEAALADAGLRPGDIGYLNLHGTGTPLNDVAESRAVERTFGRELPCSSTKGFTGHLLGAAAGVEAALTLLALRAGLLPQNLHLEQLDPEVSIRVLSDDERAPGLRFAMSNSFAFGGNDTALAFGVRP